MALLIKGGCVGCVRNPGGGALVSSTGEVLAAVGGGELDFLGLGGSAAGLGLLCSVGSLLLHGITKSVNLAQILIYRKSRNFRC